MGWSKYILSGALLLLVSCSISYKFEGGSVNYDLTKTIHIADFPDRTSFYSPMASMFNLALRRRFVEQTRLREVSSNADIELEGEITDFNVQGMAVKEDAYSSQTRLTITVHVQYINNKEAGKDVDQSFSAFQEFPSTSSINDVQDDLVTKIIAELVDVIYNATIANW
ncbi:MAG: LPS assembly lipoprotein LptE [Candidatus Azobacteroides sp.]|nr:LPS assembly lipoprotein LptE [Candidatus Azobacteroides sp.]